MNIIFAVHLFRIYKYKSTFNITSYIVIYLNHVLVAKQYWNVFGFYLLCLGFIGMELEWNITQNLVCLEIGLVTPPFHEQVFHTLLPIHPM